MAKNRHFTVIQCLIVYGINNPQNEENGKQLHDTNMGKETIKW